jgi:hypothetical protein
MKNLPKHLQETVNNYENKCRKFGLNPNFAKEALEKANKNGNDFNPIHGLV